jgi:hypothetical protein
MESKETRLIPMSRVWMIRQLLVPVFLVMKIARNNHSQHQIQMLVRQQPRHGHLTCLGQLVGTETLGTEVALALVINL